MAKRRRGLSALIQHHLVPCTRFGKTSNVQQMKVGTRIRFILPQNWQASVDNIVGAHVAAVGGTTENVWEMTALVLSQTVTLRFDWTPEAGIHRFSLLFVTVA